MVWGTDPGASSPSVTQVYIADDQPGDFAATAFAASQGTWNGVVESTFDFVLSSDLPEPGACPSLVRECPGKQKYDGINHVGWLPLKGCCTLGVTWFGSSTEGPETDMALNTNFTWPETAGNFNAQTVFLHENGHVFGAGHSTVPDAVMEAIYGGQRLTLAARGGSRTVKQEVINLFYGNGTA